MGTINDDLRVGGTLTAKQFVPPDACITAKAIQASAGIEATKLQHQHALRVVQAAGADVASKTEPIYIVRGATATVIEINVLILTAATGTGTPATDKKFTVDLQKGNQSTGFATLLSSVITVGNSTAARQVVAGTLVASPALADGDTLEVIVTASGTTGTQAQGLAIVVTIREDAD